MATDPEYNRKWSLCRVFAANASCSHSPCKYSHSLIDTTRIVALVGEVTSASFTSPSTSLASSPGSTNATQEQTFFIVEYTKYSAQIEGTGVEAEATKWRMKLLGGGRATLAAGEESVSVYPVYPVKGQGKEAGVALDALESRIFGRSALVSSQAGDPSKPKLFADVMCSCFPFPSSLISPTLRYAEYTLKGRALEEDHADSVIRFSIRIESRSCWTKLPRNADTKTTDPRSRLSMWVGRAMQGLRHACGE